MTPEELLAKMQKAPDGYVVSAYMPSTDITVEWVKRGDRDDSPWVYESTQSFRHAKDLASMLTGDSAFQDPDVFPGVSP